MIYVYLLQYVFASENSHLPGNPTGAWHTHSAHAGPAEAFLALREVSRAEREWRQWQVMVREVTP